MDESELRAAILELLARRRPGASACPSEVARGTGRDDWRALMPAVRAAAAALAQEGRLLVTQNGDVLCPRSEWHGPVRLQLPSRPPEV
jgi:hypothetical protein